MTTPTKEQIDIIRTKQCQKVRKHHSCKECIWSYNGPVCKENKKLAEEVYKLGKELKEARLNLFILGGERGK
ncbi:MAG: hypothetical protein IKB61_02540 [Elusimicrobiaceae bacterium]|nr:hypothetical protein [Elusimicrobiaceae bacterium]MBR4355377.1 hypothetical protein [Elusimicrobiaceae bacterium]